MCVDQEVVLVGGGNSAGQAAVFLAAQAKKVWMLVRGSALAASMSTYLIHRISATPNIEVLFRTQIVAVREDDGGGITSVTWRDNVTGAEKSADTRNVFLFLGADPETDWLAGCGVATDPRGFIKTGAAVADSNPRRGLLETSVPGLLAIGDVRAGSVKRVGAAIGEGAAAVAEIHALLARERIRPASLIESNTNV
jgi:thioredoxin reductase (NADPH)